MTSFPEIKVKSTPDGIHPATLDFCKFLAGLDEPDVGFLMAVTEQLYHHGGWKGRRAHATIHGLASGEMVEEREILALAATIAPAVSLLQAGGN